MNAYQMLCYTQVPVRLKSLRIFTIVFFRALEFTNAFLMEINKGERELVVVACKLLWTVYDSCFQCCVENNVAHG